MSRKNFYRAVVFILIAALGILLSTLLIGKRPFRNLNIGQVQSISLFAVPPGVTVDIYDKKHTEEIVKILNTVVVYMEDDSGREYVGQLVRYTLYLTDGTVLEVGAYNPFIFINGKCYRTKYEPCEKLSAYGNTLIKKSMN